MENVGIINYKSGNIESLKNSLNYLGFNTILINKKKDLINLSHIILPGVGAFEKCIQELKKNKAIEEILKLIRDRKIFILGICVGMQMLFEESSEFGRTKGLNLLDGKITKIKSYEFSKIPHVGWNNITFKHSFGGFSKLRSEDFYFDHSYAYMNVKSKDLLASCIHGDKFVAAVRKSNIFGTQFHPEKSQASGLAFLKSFLELKC